MKLPIWLSSGSLLIATALTAANYNCRSCEGRSNSDSRSYYESGHATPFYYDDWNDNDSDEESSSSQSHKKMQKDKGDNETSMSDRTAKKDLNNKVREVVKNYKKVSFKIRQGIVTLTGNVDNEQDHKDLVKKIGKIDGIKNVDDRLEVKGAKKSASGKMTSQMSPAEQGMMNGRDAMQAAMQPKDAQVRSKVQDALKGSMLNKSFEFITVDVNNGVVILVGVVDNENDKKDLNKRVQAIEGVKSIDDSKVKVKAGKISYR